MENDPHFFLGGTSMRASHLFFLSYVEKLHNTSNPMHSVKGNIIQIVGVVSCNDGL